MGKKIISPLQYCGSMDSALFEHWFEKHLMLSLPSSTTIVMDNASFHSKSKLALIASKYGHTLIFLPPYSPELNPIEHFWAWIKSKLRKILSLFDNFDDALSYCFNVI